MAGDGTLRAEIGTNSLTIMKTSGLNVLQSGNQSQGSYFLKFTRGIALRAKKVRIRGAHWINRRKNLRGPRVMQGSYVTKYNDRYFVLHGTTKKGLATSHVFDSPAAAIALGWKKL